MSQLRRFFKERVYDSSQGPVQWAVHPHDVYKTWSRVAAAALGSIVPFGFFLLNLFLLESDSLEKLGNALLGVLLTVVAALWIISIILASAAEVRSLVDHIVLGTVGPAYLIIISNWIQGLQ